MLAEPRADVLLTDERGLPCIETKTTADLERDLGMPGGVSGLGGRSAAMAVLDGA